MTYAQEKKIIALWENGVTKKALVEHLLFNNKVDNMLRDKEHQTRMTAREAMGEVERCILKNLSD